LQRDDVRLPAFVLLGPDQPVIMHIDQFHADRQLLAALYNAPAHDRLYIQFLFDRGQVDLLALVSKHG
jgi:hypothetical protein